MLFYANDGYSIYVVMHTGMPTFQRTIGGCSCPDSQWPVL